MSFTIGGALIKRMELTASHGLTPASATIEAYGGDVFLSDSPVVLNIGSFVFNGIITDSRLNTDEGQSLHVVVTDNRILLQDDAVYCFFNGVEIIEDDPTTPGIDRKKRFFHILPEDWETQKKTYTEQAKTAQEICQALFGSSTVHNGWSGNFTSEFQNPVLGFDANTGKKLGTAIQEICDAIGVQMTLSGSNQLDFSVKGIGIEPTPSSFDCTNISYGNARGPQATRLRVVGDRNLYQDMPITLEKDWSSHFEQFWFKPAWVQRVIDVFGLSTDPADRGAAEAKARRVTLREYADESGEDAEDRGTWGEVSRMEIPAWIYIDDIVFKAYRVPSDYSINGLPLSSLELRDGLLCAVENSEAGDFNYKDEEVYPEAKAYCAVKGQPISLYDPKTKEGITPAQFAAMRTLWQANNRFNLDTKNKVIIFEEAVFVDSAGSGALFIQPNTGIGGLAADVENLVVPNASAIVTAAQVRASICFEAERFSKDFGSGRRNEPRYVSGLQSHSLLTSGSFTREIDYADGDTADEKSVKIGAAALVAPEYITSGGFTRWGSAGTILNGAIDRITVTLYFESGGEGEGISEHIEYSKERYPAHFESTLELQRRGASRDLFPGQKALEESARQSILLGKLQKAAKRQSERGFENLDAFTTRLPGNRDCGAFYAYATSDGSIPVGMPVFVDDEKFVDQSQANFAGVITSHNVPNDYGHKIPLASQGTVPVRVQGPVKNGDSIGADDGDDFAKANGKKFIGTCVSDYAGSQIVLLPVRLTGSGSSSVETPFQVVSVPSDNPDDPPNIGVISNSHLNNSEDRDTYEEDNSSWGLLNDDGSAGSFPADEIGDKIWLEIKFARDQSIEEINVRHGSVGGMNWEEYPDPISINTDDPGNPYQEFYNQLIAEITDPDEDPRPGFSINKGTADAPDIVQITQILFTDLQLTTAHTTKDADQPNLPILVALPWHWPGTNSSGNADPITDGVDIMTPFALGETFEKELPFQVVPVPDQGETIIGVVSNSHLNNTEDKDTYEEDNSDWGLLSDDRSSGGFDVGDIGDKIWLEIQLDRSQVIVQINLRYGTGGGSGWDEYPDPISINTDDPDHPYQEFYNQIIAEITDPDEDPRPGFIITKPGDIKVQVTQVLESNLQLTTARTTADAEEPDLPLLVAIPWMGPATDLGGNADPINNGTNIATPFALGTKDIVTFSFELVDASRDGEGWVRILDGSVVDIEGVEHIPQGMGGDGLEFQVEDDDAVFMVIFYSRETGEIFEPVTIDVGEAPDDEPGKLVVEIGYVNFDAASVEPRVIPHNTLCGDYQFALDDGEIGYSFQMLDATETNPLGGVNAYQVRILDGDVLDQNGDPTTPTGMGNDDYILQVNDNDDVWLAIEYDTSDYSINEVTLAAGDMPDDDPEHGLNYVKIGFVNVDPDGELIIRNTLLGDYVFEPPPEINAYSFKMMDASDSSAKVRILDGSVVDVDGNEHIPQGMGGDGLTFQVEDDDAVFMVIFYSRETGEIFEPVTIDVGNAPDDSPGQLVVEIGYVNFDESSSTPKVIPHNTLCGDYQFALDDGDIGYAFQLLDATDTNPLGGVSAYQVRILDGDVIAPDGTTTQPEGMGNDDFLLQVQDNNDIWLEIDYDPQNFSVNQVTIAAGSQIPDDDVENGIVYRQIGYVLVDENGDLIAHNTVCGDYRFERPADPSRFAFKLSDASDSHAKVQILDGEVFGVNDIQDHNGHAPAGMGNDDYTLEVTEGDEIWLDISLDDSDNITAVSINKGADIPDDETNHKFVKIGFVSVDFSSAVPLVTPTNVLCGDYYFPAGSSFQYAFQLTDGSEGGSAKVTVDDGIVTDFNSNFEPGEQSLDISNNQYVWLEIDFETDDTLDTYGLITDVSINKGAAVPDSDFDNGLQYISLGSVTVSFDQQGNAHVAPTQLIGGSLAFQICGGFATYWSIGPVGPG